MKQFGKVLAAALATIMIAGLMVACGGSSSAAHVEGSAGLEYTLSDDGNSYVLSGRGTCTDRNVVIGNWHEGKPVTAISAQALNPEFSLDIWDIDSITVSEGIKTIEFGGIWGTTAKKVILPNSLEVIPEQMLGNFEPYTTELVIGTGVKKIEVAAYWEGEGELKIYYRGSEADWNNIEIVEKGNSIILDAPKVFNYSDK